MKTKRILCILLVLLLTLSILPVSAMAAGTLPFTDVKMADWFYDSVRYVYREGLMSGTGGSTFSPNATTTRGMIVTVLHRMEGTPVAYGAAFSDVQAGAYYADAVAWASDCGIVTGYGNGCFGPNDPISRQQLAAILFRYAAHCGKNTADRASLGGFSDWSAVADYAADALQWAVAEGLINGMGGRLEPNGSATRAQVAAILERFCSSDTTVSILPPVIRPGFGPEEDEDEKEEETPEAQVKLALTTNEVLTYDSETDSYVLTGLLDTLSGTMTLSDTVKKAALQILCRNKNMGTFSFTPGESWTVEGVGFLPGENTLRFLLNEGTRNEQVLELTVFCTTEENIGALVEDTASDTDSDSLPNYIEELFGTDPEADDTDGDGLPDDAEGNILGCDARLADTDKDGLSDGEEDPDEDGLTNLRELALGTDPCKADTDGDGLSDGEEVTTYKTDPTAEDTDADGMTDGWEAENGTDPCTAEDTVPMERTLQMGDLSTTVHVGLPGSQAQSLQIQPADEEALSRSVPGQLSDPVSLTVDGQLPEDGATLEFRLPAEYPREITGDFVPTVYYYNPDNGLLEPMPTTYENGVARAQLEHFSVYILLNARDFDEVWSSEIRKPGDYGQDHPDRLDVVLVIDSSGSMGSNDRNKLRHEAAKQFIAKLGEKDRAAVIDFDSYTHVLCNFTNDKAALNAAINRVDSSGGTSLTNGISPAINMFLDSSYQNEAYRYIIMLTDGDGSYSSSLTAKAKENNILIYTIGLGSGVNQSLLQTIASGTGGKYYFASSADALIEIYDKTATETVDYSTDSNNDGISDYYTRQIAEGVLRSGTGSNYFAGALTQEILDLFPDCLDVSELLYQAIQANDDFDGDGKKNGEEMKVSESGDKVYIRMLSDPTRKNSDIDPFPDNQEYNFNGTLRGHPFEYDISRIDNKWITDNELYVAALSAERYVDDWWYRTQLGISNYVYGGEYDWSYAAEKQILSAAEDYTEQLIESYETIYIAENFITIINEYLDDLNDYLDVIETATLPAQEADKIKEILGYMVKLTEVRRQLDVIDLSDMDKVRKLCSDAAGYTKKIDDGVEALKDFPDFSSNTVLAKLSLKVPKWVKNAGEKAGKIGDALEYIVAVVDNIDAAASTISGYAALTAAHQVNGAMYDMVCNLENSSDVGFVSVAAGNIRLSLENQFIELVNEAKLLTQDTIYSWDEVAIDAFLLKCGPYGWAVALGRGLSNLISGIGDTAKAHIYMIAAGESGRSAARLLNSSYTHKLDDYYQIGENTLDYLLLAGVLRIDGENRAIASSDAQSWLYKKLNDHEGLVELCEGTISTVKGILKDYGLWS